MSAFGWEGRDRLTQALTLKSIGEVEEELEDRSAG